MLNDRLSAAQMVASHLFPTESLIEDAILRASRLAIAIVEGRQSASLPITAGQASLTEVANATASLIEARARIGAAHASLAEDKIQAGLGARSMGDWGECPKTASADADQVSGLGLKVVA